VTANDRRDGALSPNARRHSGLSSFLTAGHASAACNAARFGDLVVLGRGTRFMGVPRIRVAQVKRAEVPILGVLARVEPRSPV